jgi:hypothetical protein
VLRYWVAGSNSVDGVDVRALCLSCVVWVAAFATDWSFYRKGLPDGCVSDSASSRNLKNESS